MTVPALIMRPGSVGELLIKQSRAQIAPSTVALETESFSSGARCFQGCLCLNKAVSLPGMADCN